MIRRSARNDPSAGSYKEEPMMKRLSDIIETTKRSEERDNDKGDIYPWLPKSHTPVKAYKTFEEAYADGFIDGKAQGFKDGLQWMGK